MIVCSCCLVDVGGFKPILLSRCVLLRSVSNFSKCFVRHEFELLYGIYKYCSLKLAPPSVCQLPFQAEQFKLYGIQPVKIDMVVAGDIKMNFV